MKPRAIAALAPAAFAFLFVAGLLAGCSLLDPYNVIGRQMALAPSVPTEIVPSARPTELTRAQREEAFDFVWRTIDERYHDPAFNGVDWKAMRERYRPLALAAADDEAFWDALDRMAGELHDSHTRVESPRDFYLREHDEVLSLGFSFLPLEHHLAVVGVDPESDAWWAGVRPGMVLVEIDGKPASEAYAALLDRSRQASTARARHFAAVRRLVHGKPGSRVEFAFARMDGSTVRARLPRQEVSRQRRETDRILPSGYGYLRFSEWSLALTWRALEALERLRDTPGLVIDLRGNPGGSVEAVSWMLARFFTQPTALGRVTTRTGAPVSVFFGAMDILKLKREVPGDPNAYPGPVVILTNGLSASGSELFAGSMQATGRAKVVGQPSCGCLLGFLGYARVPGGGELAYSEIGFVLPNGKRIEGEGVLPDVEVPLQFADLATQRDRTLEEAEALLARMSPVPD